MVQFEFRNYTWPHFNLLTGPYLAAEMRADDCPSFNSVKKCWYPSYFASGNYEGQKARYDDLFLITLYTSTIIMMLLFRNISDIFLE
jgi:hypothetical protein